MHSLKIRTTVPADKFQHVCVNSCMFSTCSVCRTVWPCFFLDFLFLFLLSKCRSFSTLLLRVTTAMAGALCGQTLPVVVRAQTISRSDGPLSICYFFCLPLTVLDGGREWSVNKKRAKTRNQ